MDLMTSCLTATDQLVSTDSCGPPLVAKDSALLFLRSLDQGRSGVPEKVKSYLAEAAVEVKAYSQILGYECATATFGAVLATSRLGGHHAEGD
eukprot:Skav218963  [mRNA]  locus=scaffold1876:225556:227298:- [translate_table: standard]